MPKVMLEFDVAEWRLFLDAIKSGEIELKLQ
jgi:hypothetical protein